MKEDCCFYTTKYLLVFFNFIFLVVGTVVLAIGIWLSVDKKSLIALLKMTDVENLTDFTSASLIEHTGYFLIGIGAVLFFLSFLGFFGAIGESRCLLISYGILLLLLFCAEIVLIALAIVYKDETLEHTKNCVRYSMLTFYSSTKNPNLITGLWDTVMSKFNCCGVDNYSDFANASGWPEHRGNRTIPEACCILRNVPELIPRDSDCVSNPNETNSYYNTGCYETVANWIKNRWVILLGILIGLDIAIFFGVFFAFYLCKSVGRIHRLRL